MLALCHTLALLSLLWGIEGRAVPSRSPEPMGPPLLNFSELKALAGPEPPAETRNKLNELLHTPFVRNRSQTASTPPLPAGSGLRVVFWNIERGLQWELIRTALTDPAQFRKRIEGEQPLSDHRWRKAEAELAELRQAEIILLNEVDLGMKRTGYADVARELAEALGMNYVFGVEFVEVDRLYTGEERIEMKTPALSQELAEDLRVDPERYRGLHGNAILTRFSIRSARIERLSECYDWYGGEVRSISAVEQGKRWAAHKAFSERIVRQVRRGGRMSLFAELEVPGVPERLTVVSTHLEDRAKSACRRQQMDELLQQVRSAPGPLVIGGDLNTSGTDGTPTSVSYEIKKRVSDPHFWVKQGIQWFTPLGIPFYIAWPVNFWKNFHDPTAINIPVFARNRARHLFQDVRRFQFADGSRFDFTGDRSRSGNGRARTLANSNQRVWKGFHPTHHLERSYGGLVSHRLDWLFVKTAPPVGGVEFFRPYHPRTLPHFNELGKERLSDHHAITVELERAPAPADRR